MKTIAHMLYKAFPRCRGDLRLDEYEGLEYGSVIYACLQCGRMTQLDLRAETAVEHRQPMAA